MTLTDKVALVTGGSRGIGAAIAKRLAREGSAVALTYTSSPDKADAVAREITENGGKALAIKAEAADAEAVKAAVDQTAQQFGRLDILVNNAGIFMMKPIDNFTVEDLDRFYTINVRAVFIAIKAALAHMGEGGRIINIGSIGSDSIPGPGGTGYVMSKAALAGITRALGRDLGPRGITINNVQPGAIDTDANPADGGFSDRQRELTALGRYGTAEEVASLVAYLATPDAAYITSTGLKVDGGWDA